jgi:hypothetical protein
MNPIVLVTLCLRSVVSATLYEGGIDGVEADALLYFAKTFLSSGSKNQFEEDEPRYLLGMDSSGGSGSEGSEGILSSSYTDMEEELPTKAPTVESASTDFYDVGGTITVRGLTPSKFSAASRVVFMRVLSNVMALEQSSFALSPLPNGDNGMVVVYVAACLDSSAAEAAAAKVSSMVSDTSRSVGVLVLVAILSQAF